jgi:hypothetical protein
VRDLKGRVDAINGDAGRHAPTERAVEASVGLDGPEGSNGVGQLRWESGPACL